MVFILDAHPNCYVAYTKWVRHGKTKIFVVRLRSFTWTSPAMLVNLQQALLTVFTKILFFHVFVQVKFIKMRRMRDPILSL